MVSPRAYRLPARASAAIAALVLLPAAAFAQASAGDQAPADVTLPTIEVIGVSPILGVGIDRDKVPANTRSFSPSDLSLEGTPALVGTLEQRVPSVNINDVQDSPFQPDVQYRGFDA